MKLRDTIHDSESQRLAQRVAKLEEKLFGVMERNSQLEEESARLRDEVARLQQQLAAARKNSSTSSKPPSSDMVKPPKPPLKGGKKRKRGGQPGHEQHLRPIFPPEAVNHFEPYMLDCCPDCGGSLRLAKRPPNILQQVEITAKPTIVTEHQGLAYWCPHCQKFHYAPLPEAVVKARLFGPRLTALVAFMKGVCHASFFTIRKFLRDVACVPISRGYLAKLIGKVSQSLAKALAKMDGMKGFTRLSLGFSKKLENLEAACAMFLAYYNFCWRTRKPDEGRNRLPAAMMAGVVDTLWTFEDLFDAVMRTALSQAG